MTRRFYNSKRHGKAEEEGEASTSMGKYQYQFGCGILKMVSSKKQDCLPKINILKGNRLILRIWGAPVRHKLGMILENKWFKN